MTERKPVTVTIDPGWWDEPIEDDYADRRNWCEWCRRPDQECNCP